jgi:hypothetical protein
LNRGGRQEDARSRAAGRGHAQQVPHRHKLRLRQPRWCQTSPLPPFVLSRPMVMNPSPHIAPGHSVKRSHATHPLFAPDAPPGLIVLPSMPSSSAIGYSSPRNHHCTILPATAHMLPSPSHAPASPHLPLSLHPPQTFHASESRKVAMSKSNL